MRYVKILSATYSNGVPKYPIKLSGRTPSVVIQTKSLRRRYIFAVNYDKAYPQCITCDDKAIEINVNEFECNLFKYEYDFIDDSYILRFIKNDATIVYESKVSLAHLIMLMISGNSESFNNPVKLYKMEPNSSFSDLPIPKSEVFYTSTDGCIYLSASTCRMEFFDIIPPNLDSKIVAENIRNELGIDIDDFVEFLANYSIETLHKDNRKLIENRQLSRINYYNALEQNFSLVLDFTKLTKVVKIEEYLQFIDDQDFMKIILVEYLLMKSSIYVSPLITASYQHFLAINDFYGKLLINQSSKQIIFKIQLVSKNDEIISCKLLISSQRHINQYKLFDIINFVNNLSNSRICSKKSIKQLNESLGIDYDYD